MMFYGRAPYIGVSDDASYFNFNACEQIISLNACRLTYEARVRSRCALKQHSYSFNVRSCLLKKATKPG